MAGCKEPNIMVKPIVLKTYSTSTYQDVIDLICHTISIVIYTNHISQVSVLGTKDQQYSAFWTEKKKPSVYVSGARVIRNNTLLKTSSLFASVCIQVAEDN